MKMCNEERFLLNMVSTSSSILEMMRTFVQEHPEYKRWMRKRIDAARDEMIAWHDTYQAYLDDKNTWLKVPRRDK